MAMSRDDAAALVMDQMALALRAEARDIVEAMSLDDLALFFEWVAVECPATYCRYHRVTMVGGQYTEPN